MSYQTPVTIKDVLEGIRNQDYVLPAIQREFVWKTDQVCGLFDSLMQGYPIGSFLFWKVPEEKSQDFTFYGFIKDFHQRKARHCPVLDVPKRSVVAILDGQQRLTSFNIALRGSHAEKLPRKRWDNDSAFPKRFLYLNLCSLAEENELGFKYDFRFLAPSRAESPADGEHWFKVPDVYAFSSGKEVHKYLAQVGLGNHDHAYDFLYDLYAVVHEKTVVPYYEEKADDLDKVLKIFIRVNSGGTPLSYSDLLLSIATAQWRETDARSVIHRLVDDLNDTRTGFRFSKDLVLKAGLLLSDISSIAFRVTNFNTRNMATLEESWSAIERALRIAAKLMGDFGFSQQNLAADSVLLPLAYYLFKRGVGDGYMTAVAHREDRDRIRGWVCRSLVKTGVWGSGLDTLLLSLRGVLMDNHETGFPVELLEQAMAKRGKPLTFTAEEIEDLLDSEYGDKRTFSLLSLLYPFSDLRNLFHIDHVFPRSRFTRGRLRSAGVAEDELDDFQEKMNRLGNLQLLDGPQNEAKRATLPAEWLAATYPDEAAQRDYCSRHDLGDIPENILAFEEFYETRRRRMSTKLRRLLAAGTDDSQD